MKWLAGMLVMSLIFLGAATFASRAADEKKDKTEPKKVDQRVFELRTYTTEPGRMQALQARFRNHTTKLFEKHGMTIIGFWTPLEQKEGEEKLIYILAYPSKEAREKSWKAFLSDPDWIKAKDDSEKDGKIVSKVEYIFMNPTDYSPIK